jgi:hypothetical protein
LTSGARYGIPLAGSICWRGDWSRLPSDYGEKKQRSRIFPGALHDRTTNFSLSRYRDRAAAYQREEWIVGKVIDVMPAIPSVDEPPANPVVVVEVVCMPVVVVVLRPAYELLVPAAPWPGLTEVSYPFLLVAAGLPVSVALELP